jgi:hypothetical protein
MPNLLAYPGNTKGGSITGPLTSCLTGLELAVWQLTKFFIYLQNRLIQTSQTGGQRYSYTSPFSIPWPILSIETWLSSQEEGDGVKMFPLSCRILEHFTMLPDPVNEFPKLGSSILEPKITRSALSSKAQLWHQNNVSSPTRIQSPWYRSMYHIVVKVRLVRLK